MTDLDRELHDRLGDLELPAAPASLHAALDQTARATPEPVRRRTSRRPLVLLVAAVTLLGVVGGAIGLSGSAPSTSPRPSAADSTAGALTSMADTTTAPPAAGFTRPGFAFDPPSGWTDQTAAASYPALPQVRFVGYLVKGMTRCPVGYGSLPPKPTGCEETATRPGTAILGISEMNHQYPWLLATVGPTSTIAGYPSVSRQSDTETSWFIQSPDGGIYQITLTSPKDEMTANVAAVAQALGSLQLTSWEEPPTIANGLIHDVTGRGFSFDYPAGWVHYYPTDLSTGSSPVVTVASSPLLPPCKTDTHPVESGASPTAPCGTYTTPPGTITVAFRIGGGPMAPDWSKANTTIAGQPAFGPEKWGPLNAAGAQEGYSWNVRMPDPGGREALSVDASLNGPGLPDLRAAMNKLLDSIKITPP